MSQNLPGLSGGLSLEWFSFNSGCTETFVDLNENSKDDIHYVYTKLFAHNFKTFPMNININGTKI